MPDVHDFLSEATETSPSVSPTGEPGHDPKPAADSRFCS